MHGEMVQVQLLTVALVVVNYKIRFFKVLGKFVASKMVREQLC